MKKKIRSIWLLVVVWLQLFADQAHRWIMGLPTLKRSQVTAHLFVGGQYDQRGLRHLRSLGITAIINMRMHSVYQESVYVGMKYLHLPTVDNTAPRMEDLIKGAEFARAEIEAGGKVYIHCRQGLGRGPTMAIAYLLSMGATYDHAYMTVKAVRPFILPTSVQVARLKELEIYYERKGRPETPLVPKT
jgi:protein tyrosine phosphatase (PTP) superfamily phosphohydrolase (DUF442 family)